MESFIEWSRFRFVLRWIRTTLRYYKYQPSRRETQLIRSDSRAPFLKLSRSPEREFERTTINELQTQHSWLSSLSFFLFPSLGPFNFSLFPFLLLASLSLSLSLAQSLSLCIYFFLSQVNYRGSVTVMHLPLALSLSFSFPLFLTPTISFPSSYLLLLCSLFHSFSFSLALLIGRTRASHTTLVSQ